MKKKKRLLLLTVALALVLSAYSLLGGRYKRIVLVPADSDEAGSAERRISLWADVEDQSSERYGDTLPIYQITPYAVTEQELVDFAAAFGVREPVQYDGDHGKKEKRHGQGTRHEVCGFRESGRLYNCGSDGLRGNAAERRGTGRGSETCVCKPSDDPWGI